MSAHRLVLITLAILLVRRSNCDSATQESNCNVPRGGIASIRLDRPPFHLTCNVIQFKQPLSLNCANNSSVKGIRDIKTYSTRITCGSNHLINWAPDFLDDAWASRTLNSNALLERRYGTAEYEGEGFGFPVGANQSLNTLVIRIPSGASNQASVRYTITGLEEVDGAVSPWTDPPITILFLFNPPQVGAKEGNLAIYDGDRDDTAEFLAWEDLLEIPCLSSSNSSTNPILMIEENHQGVCRPSLLTPPVSTFNPLHGFSLNTSTLPAKDIYYYCCPKMVEHCFSSGGCIEFNVYHRQSVEAYPQMPTVRGAPLRLFVTTKNEEKAPVRLQCRFMSPVKLIGQLNFVPLNCTAGDGSYTLRQIKTGSRPRFLATLRLRLHEGDVLNVDCVDSDNSTLYSWNITVHDAGPPSASNAGPSYLRMHPLREAAGVKGALPEPVFQCYSDVYDDASLQLVQCEDPMQCRILVGGLDTYEGGPGIQKGAECSRPETEASVASVSCQQIKMYSPGALLLCSAGEYSYDQMRWMGLSGNSTFAYKRLDFMNKSLQQEMILLRPGSNWESDPNPATTEYYTKMAYNFTCIVHTFWSGGLARFAVGKQGDGSNFQPTNGTTTVSVWTSPQFQQTEQFVFSRTDVDRVVCQAPVRDMETAWITASMSVRVLESQEPVILNTELDFNWGDDSTVPKEIPCAVEGLPPSVITWTRRVDGNTIVIGSDTELNVHVVNSSTGQLTLIFKTFSASAAGNYTCTATNGVGNAYKDFYVAMVDNMSESQSGQPAVWAAASGSIAVFLLLLILVAVIGRRLQLRYRRVLSRLDIYQFRYGMVNDEGETEGSEQAAGTEAVELEVTAVASQEDDTNTAEAATWLAAVQNQPFDTSFEIPRDEFKLYKDQPLGSGQFGEVYLGTVRLGNIGDEVEVGIKVPKLNCPPNVLKAMLKELKIMTRLKHENIVSLVGACTARAEYGELYILMEFCRDDSVENFFEPNTYRYVEQLEDESEAAAALAVPYCGTESLLRQISFSGLVGWCVDIAAGMEYLASQWIVHRDLATRNVLLTKLNGAAGWSWRAKVSDFGLSRELQGSGAYQQSSVPDVIPALWMAPECFDGTFTTKSDVWAFGITAWEIFSLGASPYTGLAVQSLAQFVDLIKSGLRITEPHRATPEIFEKLEECWKENPNERPSFTNLTEFFRGFQ